MGILGGRNRFCKSVLAEMRDVSGALLIKLLKAKDDGYLSNGEYQAFWFCTVGPYGLAQSLLDEKASPLYGFKRDDVSSEDIGAKAYTILQFTLLHVLREIMYNSTEVTAAIGTQYADLIEKYCTILGYSASDVKVTLAIMDEDMLELKEHLYDPRPAWFRQFTRFHEMITGEAINISGLREELLYSSLWDELLTRLSRLLHERLGVNTMAKS